MDGIVFVVCPGRNIRLKDARILAPGKKFTVFPTGELPGIPGPHDVEDGGEIRNYHNLGFVQTEEEMLAANQKKLKIEADAAAVVARDKAKVAQDEAEKAEKKAKATPEKPPAGGSEGGTEPPAETAKDKKARLKKEAAEKAEADKKAPAAKEGEGDKKKEGDKKTSNAPPGDFS